MRFSWFVIVALFCADELALILSVASVYGKRNKQRKKVKTSAVKYRCLHTYLHTADNCLLSVVNIEVFVSIFSHNPLVPGSSPGGPTNNETPVSDGRGFAFYATRTIPTPSGYLESVEYGFMGITKHMGITIESCF